MAYIERQDLIDRFGEDELVQLTDRVRAGVIDEAVLASAIADAEAEVDGYLGARYRLPLDPVPAVIKRLVGSIARCHLYDGQVVEVVENACKSARATLRDLAAGKMTLGGAESAQAPSPVITDSGAPVHVSSVGRAFTADTLSGYLP